MVNLVLIGLRGTGKSTIGRILAGRLQRKLFDTDMLIQQRAGLSIREIFAQFGEPHFRKLEADVVRACAAEANAVIATGGGAVLDPASVRALRTGGFVVHLTASASELWRRISQDQTSASTRPKLLEEARSGIEELEKLMAARASAYAAARDTEVCVEGRAPEILADAIMEAARQHGIG